MCGNILQGTSIESKMFRTQQCKNIYICNKYPYLGSIVLPYFTGISLENSYFICIAQFSKIHNYEIFILPSSTRLLKFWNEMHCKSKKESGLGVRESVKHYSNCTVLTSANTAANQQYVQYYLHKKKFHINLKSLVVNYM